MVRARRSPALPAPRGLPDFASATEAGRLGSKGPARCETANLPATHRYERESSPTESYSCPILQHNHHRMIFLQNIAGGGALLLLRSSWLTAALACRSTSRPPRE